jgi:hypothetical protein
MNPFRRRGWPASEWIALGEAFVVLAAVRIALALMEWKRVERLAGAVVRRLAPAPGISTLAEDARLGRAMHRAALLVPGAKCLAQATAGMIVAARRGHRSRMTIGVKLGSREPFGAHAWLETANGIPVGGAEAVGFAPLMTIDPYGGAPAGP